MQSANRVIVNTAYIYIRLLFTIVIGLFTTRLVLNSLGETDYGIYTLSAGVIGMLSVLNSAMSSASMRFMSHGIGNGDKDLIKQTFNSTLIIHLGLGVLVIMIMEIMGFFMFKYWLNIPPERMSDAKLVFHFMVLSTFMTIISVPFDAVMNARETFKVKSLIEMFGTLVNLGIALYISVVGTDLLVTYAFLVFLNQLLQRIIKQWYSRTHFEECKVKLREYVDKDLIKRILSYTGWNILSTGSGIIINQSRNILINLFFGVKLNAANGVSNSLTSQLNSFSVSMTQAINPQIMKTEGGGGRERMVMLTMAASKFSVFLFAVFSIPVFIEAPYILQLWLGKVPDFVVIFTRLTILVMFIEKFTFPLTTAINAVGNIKAFTIVGVIVSALTIPFAYVLFYYGAPPQAIYWVAIFISFLLGYSRLYYAHKLASVNPYKFLKTVFLKSIGPIILAVALSVLPVLFLKEGFIRLLLTVSVSVISSVLFICFFGLTKDEYNRFKDIAILIKKRFLHKKKT